MRYLRMLLVVALSATALAAIPASASAGAGDQMIATINAVRAAHHLRPLVASVSLGRSSYGYARYLVTTHRFAHSSHIPGFRRSGEVLERHLGRYAFVRRTVRAWLRSPGHRAVLLSPSFRYLGVGLSSGVWSGRRTSIWVARLGS